MILEYVKHTKAFVIRVPRSSGRDIQTLMMQHGLDMSMPASTPETAVLFTHEPYAAAAFWSYATPGAKEQLGPIYTEILASWQATSKINVKVPADQELWAFQKADIEYALRRKHSLIGDQPGLGKTPIAIAFANEVAAKRVLVICPANIRHQWAKKISEWSVMPWTGTRRTHIISTAKNGVSDVAPWTVVSYDMARVPAIWNALLREYFDVLILDEAHYLKTVDAKRTRSVFSGGQEGPGIPIASRCNRILALTGTPLPNRPREAYTLSRHLCWDAIDWASEDAFRERYNPSRRIEHFNPKTGQNTWAIDERTGRHAELQSRLRANFMTRHLKREVMPQLKMPVYDLIQVEETVMVKQALKAESLLDIDPENLEGADATVLGHIAAVRRQMGVALAPQVAEYIEMLLKGGEDKLVVFAWHTEVMDILEAALAKFGVCRIDGSTSAWNREIRKEQFIKLPAKRIMLGNILAMGIGTDGLQTVAWHALIAEPDWTPGNNIQAFDRLDRGGQTGRVQGDIFVAPGSIAERVLASALRKLQTIHNTLDKRA